MSENKSKLIIKVLLIIFFSLCLFNMPYGYYQLVRFFGIIGFVVISNEAYKSNDNAFMIIWFASALLINPFFKIALGRTLWNIIDVIWIILLTINLKQNHLKL